MAITGKDSGGALWSAVFVGVAFLAGANTAHGAPTPEHACQAGLAKSAAKYALCAQKKLAKFNATPQHIEDEVAYSAAVGKCVTKYAATWALLAAKASGSGATCDNGRFVDNGDGTVTDRLTGLQWEKKTTDATVHDVNNDYSWSAGVLPASGTAFTSFLAALNSSGCFAGQCDWRLPTRDELLTITTPAYPACTTGPCIDPVFGPTAVQTFGYWSDTSASAPQADRAWGVGFAGGGVGNEPKIFGQWVRAVRGGL